MSVDGIITVFFYEDRIHISKPESVSIYFERGDNINGKIFPTDICIKGSKAVYNHNGAVYSAEFGSMLRVTPHGYEVTGNSSETDIRFGRGE